ncbi:MAG TPA: serine/threonine-protein kinase, partial [Anaerolineae bacterium]|nr:serine/threonine-protein kinase [Anaerolineae bacterium]
MTDEIRTHTILNNRYEIQRELGRGGMGAVYLAQDLRYRKPVAIKVARLGSPEARAQFRREADYLQKLHHHSLPRVWETFSDTQRDFLVMEYIPGDDLETLVQRKGAQPEWQVLRWIDELLDGLAFLHTQTPPIIHRDIKPGNLKLRGDGSLVLVDFGIAKEYLPGVNTFAGATAVTPGFSPPEQYSDSLTDAR